MTPTKQKREWVKRTVEKWRPRLFLGEWMIESNIQKTPLSAELLRNAIRAQHIWKPQL